MKNNVIIADKTTDYKNALNYSFNDNNIVYISENESIKSLEKIANDISNSKNVTFLNLNKSNDFLINILPKKIHKTVILQYSISELSDIDVYNQLLLTMKYLDSGLIQNVYCLDYSSYLIFKNQYKFKYLQLDTEIFNNDSGEGLGLIAHPGDYYAGIMNEVSAITLTDYTTVKIYKPEQVVTKFCKRFGIKVIKTKNLTETLSGNEINLYVNFCNISYALILESMDKGIPCVLGNTDFFDSNKTLKEFLVLRSDDSIDEIKEKIDLIKNNKEKIFDEYKKFRKEYTKKSQKSLEEFISELN